MSKYGYKVCYKQEGGEKLKVYLVTNTYDLAYWHIRWYENHSPPIKNVIWQIVPIKTLFEYKLRWRNCPF
jgi:hypothetical protein